MQQQLAHLKLVMLQTVHALAGRVQTAAELCEVVTGVLTGAAASLNYPSCSSPPVLSLAGGPASAAVALGGSGAGIASPFQPAAALPPTASFGGAGAGSREVVATPLGAPDHAKLAAAVMALQLAAAAADGCLSEQQDQFVTPFNSFTGTAPSTSGSSSPRSLPGGVLPPKLVAAAQPLLTQGPHVLRHAVQRILLALLPAAPQVRRRCGCGSAAMLSISLAGRCVCSCSAHTRQRTICLAVALVELGCEGSLWLAFRHACNGRVCLPVHQEAYCIELSWGWCLARCGLTNEAAVSPS